MFMLLPILSFFHMTSITPQMFSESDDDNDGPNTSSVDWRRKHNYDVFDEGEVFLNVVIHLRNK